MNLHEFIKELEDIAGTVDAKHTPIQMADTLPVVVPVLKDGVVYVSDQE